MPPTSTRLRAFQKPFLLSCLRDGIRTDGRSALEGRQIRFKFSFTERGHAEVTIGATRVLCCVSGEVVRPRPDQPSDGQISFNVDLSPMANSDFDIRPTVGTLTHERSAELSLMIESLLKKSRAIDTEALCIEGGAKVWSLNVELRVLDDDGNIKDATALAALAGLLHFRRKKEIEHRGTNRDADRLPPTPLSIHHMPVLITLCFVDGTMVVDPNRDEEAVSIGQISIAVNQFRELCGVRKAGGLPIPSDTLRYAIQIAAARAMTVVEQLMASLKTHDTERESRRKNIWRKYAEADPVSVPIQEGKLDESMKDDIEDGLKIVAAKKEAEALKSKVKRKRRKLLKAAKAAKAVKEAEEAEEAEEARSSVRDVPFERTDSSSPQRRTSIKREETKLQEVQSSKREVIMLCAESEVNECDAAEDSNDLFSQAVIKKSKKKKTKSARPSS